jgi:hypothetical protein
MQTLSEEITMQTLSEEEWRRGLWNSRDTGCGTMMFNFGTLTCMNSGPIYPLYEPPVYCDYCDSDISTALTGKCPNCGASKTKPRR